MATSRIKGQQSVDVILEVNKLTFPLRDETPPPPDATPVGALSIVDKEGTHRIQKLYASVDGEPTEMRLVVKVWAIPAT